MAVSAELALEISKFKAGLNAASQSVRSAASEMKHEMHGVGESFHKAMEFGGLKEGLLAAIGGGTLLGVGEAIHAVSEQYARLYDVARRFDVSTDSIQRVDLAAKFGGVEGGIQGLIPSLQRLQKSLEDVGSEKVKKALSELRLSAVDLAGVGPEKQIELLAHAFTEAQSRGEGFAATFDLMGKGAGELTTLLRDYHEIAEKVHNAPILNEDDVRTLKEFSDGWTALWNSVKVGGAKLIMHPQDTLGGLMDAADAADEAAKEQYHPETKKAEAAPDDESPWQKAMGMVRWGKDNASTFIEKDAAAKRIAAAEEKAIAKEMEGLERARHALQQARIAAMDAELNDLEKIESAQADVKAIDEKIASLAGPGIELEKQRIELLTEREKLLQKIAEAEKRHAEEVRRGRDEAAQQGRKNKMEAIDALPPQQRAAALRDELGKELGLKPGFSGADVAGAIKGLRSKAANEASAEDFEGSKRDFKAADDAQGLAKKIADMPSAPRPMGALGGQINALLGKSHSELVVDEAKKQTGLLEKLDAQLRVIAENTKSGSPAQSPWISGDTFTN